MLQTVLEARKDRLAFGVGDDSIIVADTKDVQGEKTEAMETYDRCVSGDEVDEPYLDMTDDETNADGQRWIVHEVSLCNCVHL